MNESVRVSEKANKKGRLLAAMSGGVDSSVAAKLMLDCGYDCDGATMKLLAGGGSKCCSLDDIDDARRVCEALGIEHFVFNFTDDFTLGVIDAFVSAYGRGETPNPCVECNRKIKFGKFISRARELGYDGIITGHYAKIRRGERGAELWRADDKSKDQTYFLWTLTERELSFAHFPLGSMKKEKTREAAEAFGLITSKKPDSQDVCFAADGKYAEFIEDYTGKVFPEGDFTLEDGSVVGRHHGIIRYTVGQRRGLGIAYECPLYVKEINAEENRVILTRGDGLFGSSLSAENANIISGEAPKGTFRAKIKIRYRHAPADASVTFSEDGKSFHAEFDTPQRAITKGQSAVIYDGDRVLGGGVIK
ncbi:MAG: tRNA 2-thiouridine(34) synthase MnmA [Firmicutes bacterium]|nr:tRNA 2-thiouridine(34) synthase MnmA [Bacillota bacterium]